MRSRERKALLVIMRGRIIPLDDGTFAVKSSKDRKTGRRRLYQVIPHDDGTWECNCERGQRGLECAHPHAVQKFLTDPKRYGNIPDDGAPGIDESRRPTYPQDNTLYKIVRVTSSEIADKFILALARHKFPIGSLRTGKRARPFSEISDMVYCICLRVLGNDSSLDAQGKVRTAFKSGMLAKRHTLDPRPPDYGTISLAMRRKHIYDAFQDLIDATNDPYKGRAEIVAIDGAEYESPYLGSRSDYGRKEGPLNWLKLGTKWYKTVKLHAAVGVVTGMFVAVRVTAGKTHDSKPAIELIEAARAQRFVTGVAADSAYVGDDIAAYLEQHKIDNLVRPKANNVENDLTALGRHVKKFRANHHGEHDDAAKRQIVECQFSRDKRTNGEVIKSKSLEAAAVELCAHVLIQNAETMIADYIAGDIEIPFLTASQDPVAMEVLDALDAARDAAKGRPAVDLSPRYRDGLSEEDVA